jgi:cytochrome c
MQIRFKKFALISAALVLGIAQLACGGGAPPPVAQAATQGAAATQSGRGTPAEAQAMLQLAVEHYAAVGREQALADFNAGRAPFIDRDLYVVCMDSNHIETANGGFPEYVGQSADGLTADNGTPLGKAIWENAAAGAVSSVKYHWINPVSGETEPKVLFYQKLDADICGVGAYNP